MKPMRLTDLISRYNAHARREYTKHGRSTNTAGNIERACRYLLEVVVRGDRLLDRQPTESSATDADRPQLDLLAQDLPGGGGEPVRCLADVEVEQLDRHDIRDYLDHLVNTKRNAKGQPWTLSHVNTQRRLVLQMVTWAEDEGLLSAEVSGELQRCKPLKPGKTAARRSQRVPAVPEDIFRKIVSELRDGPQAPRKDHRRKRRLLAIAVELLWETGMRPIELVVMRRCDIHGDEYRPPEWKTEHVSERPRVVGLSRRGRELVDEAVFVASSTDGVQANLGYAVEFDPEARLFGWKASHPYHARSAFYNALKRALARAGLADAAVTLLQHRHAFATRAVRVSVEGARVQLGHDKLTTTSIYLDDTAEARRGLLNGMDGPNDHETPPDPPPRKTGTDDQEPPHQLRLVRD